MPIRQPDTVPADSRRPPSILLLMLLAGMLVSGCAKAPVVEIVNQLRPRISADRIGDLQLSAFLSGTSDRRAMRSTEDVDAWLDAWWKERDPTPDTDRNEALEVYRSRVAWLAESQPEVPFAEWDDRGIAFVRYGTPDGAGPEYVPWRKKEDGLARTPARIVQVARDQLRYRTPEHFTLVFHGSELLRDMEQEIPETPPSLASAWQYMESPVASVIDRRRALVYLSWYELPDVAVRLLKVPESRMMPLGDLRQQAFRRLAHRLAYLHGTEGARRLAVLTALNVEVSHLLSRAASPPYTAAQLAEDLQRFEDVRYRVPRSPRRGPHPDVWSDVEALLERLVTEHPDPNSLTGWDWQGDLLLAMGPPGHLDVLNRTAYYFWGTPEAMGIGETMLGSVESVRLGDMLNDFARDIETDAEERGRAAEEAAGELASALGVGGNGGINDELLRRLNELAPPNVFRAGLPPNPSYRSNELLPITVDVVSFPASGDSVEVQASFGIPASAVGIRPDPEGGYRTALRANLVLVDRQVRVRQAFSRQGGYRVAGDGDVSSQVFLDTFRFLAPIGQYVLYLSAEDPAVGRSGGVLASVDLKAPRSEELTVSPILLAADISPAVDPGKFVRGNLQILPVPSRQFLYGQDLYFYFEVNNLVRSEVGDHVWDEVFYVIPESEGEGIVRFDPEDDMTGLRPTVERSMAIDLGSMAETYEGGVFLVVMVTDRTTGAQAVSATRFSLYRPAPGQAPRP